MADLARRVRNVFRYGRLARFEFQGLATPCGGFDFLQCRTNCFFRDYIAQGGGGGPATYVVDCFVLWLIGLLVGLVG